jgi:hypothetical protein
MGVVVYMIRLSLSVEGDERDLTVIDDPDAADGITIALHGRKSQQFSQIWMVRNHSRHRFQVDNIDALVEGHPKPVVIVLGNTPARLAVQVKPGFHDTITVVANQASAIRRDPKKTAGVLEDVVDMIMGKAVAQVQIGEVVPICQQIGSVDFVE